jgi:lysozyme family protein
MRTNGVPAPLIFGFHMRESDNNFHCHLHEGSSLLHRTRDEPKGRPLHPEPPYLFEVSAEDALYGYEHLEKHDWQHLESALQWAISYNGMGYDKRGLPSPYMWAGTNIYRSGKYVSDGRFDGHAVDKQLGLAAVMLRMKDHGIAMPFEQ